MKITHKILSIFALIATLSSCSDVLDQAPDGKVSLDEVFADEVMVEAYLNTCYKNLPYKGFQYWFFDNHPIACSDDSWSSDDGAGQAVQDYYAGTASSTYFPLTNVTDGHGTLNNEYWNRYFPQIRHCNLFLSRIGDAAVRDEASRKRMEAEARVMRAYFYMELVLWYGKVPIIETALDVDDDFSELKRNSIYEIATFINNDLADVVSEDYLPWRITTSADAGRATKALAYMIMSKMMLWAASPLHNEGEDHWQEAYEICKEAYTKLSENGYELYSTCSLPELYSESGDAAAYHQLMNTEHVYAANPSDKETIFQAPYGGCFTWHVAYVGGTFDGSFSVGSAPSQELVDSYDTTDGRTVLDLENPYNDAETHLMPNFNASNTLYDDTKPYENRDPRMAATVICNEDKITWSDVEYTIELFVGGREEPSQISSARKYSRTGYLHKKHVTPGASQNNMINNPKWKYYRFAEVMMNYAEAAFEAGHADEAKAMLDLVRARVNMPAIPISDVTQARIRNERRVEFAFEEQRYFDVRRWQSPDGDLSKTDKYITRINITKNTNGTFNYERALIWSYPRGGYSNKYLLAPIPLSEVTIMNNVTGDEWQNPGW